MRIVVVGAGFGGLAAAIRLRAMGHEVAVVEKNDRPGGRAAVFEREGFTFDAGPTILTAPHFIDELFALAGRRREDYVSLVPLDPFYRIRFDDGSVLDRSARDDELERQVSALSPGDVAGFRRFCDDARRIFEEAMPLIDQPADSLGSALRFAPSLLRTRAWRAVADVAARRVRDQRLRQALSFHPLLIGGHPFHAPSLYALIWELERRWGVWYALGGTGALVRALARLLEETGAALHCGAEATEIAVDSSRRAVAGVRLRDGTVLAADAVVCNADVEWSRGHLVPPRYRRPRRRLAPLRYGMSVFVLYFGTNRRYDEVRHHEIVLGPRYRGLIDDVFRHGVLAEDCSLYVHRPTATDASLAPPGCDAWYALAPVPHLGASIDWAREGDRVRDQIVARLEARLLPDLSRHIVTERRIDPRYFRDAFNSTLGAAFSLEPLLSQSAWFRPPAASAEIRNLFYVGAGTHPGAGIPGVLSSAKIVAELIAQRVAGQPAAPVAEMATA